MLVVTSSGSVMDVEGWASGEGRPRLVALSPVSGSRLWEVDLPGLVAQLEPFPGGVYALVIGFDATSGGEGMHRNPLGSGLMRRSIAAIGEGGTILWILDLDE